MITTSNVWRKSQWKAAVRIARVSMDSLCPFFWPVQLGKAGEICERLEENQGANDDTFRGIRYQLLMGLVYPRTWVAIKFTCSKDWTTNSSPIIYWHDTFIFTKSFSFGSFHIIRSHRTRHTICSRVYIGNLSRTTTTGLCSILVALLYSRSAATATNTR